MKKLIMLSCALLVFLSCSQNQHSAIKVKTQGNQSALVFQDVNRMDGIHPVLQNTHFEFDEIQHKKNKLFYKAAGKSIAVDYQVNDAGNIISFYLSPNNLQTGSGQDFLGLFFEDLPHYKQGVAMWRYKPWNSWSKPVQVNDPSELQAWDVQFYYWQYSDGVYGAAMPMGGNGFRATLGQHNGAFGAKATSLVDSLQRNNIPMLAIGFSSDPYALFADLFEQGMTWMGKPENLRWKKSFPKQFEKLGWCTWNASEKGKRLNENFVGKSLLTFAEQRFPLGWVLIDDGWFDHQDRQLNRFAPDSTKFPNGFKLFIDTLKKRLRLQHVGVWHAMNGYWNGINPDSPLGEKYADDLFSWQQLVRPDQPEGESATYHFIRPDSDSLAAFYADWHVYLQSQGFDFIKVDNQLVTEKMAVNNYPVFDLAEAMHEALNKSAMQHFDGGLLNCMDMTVDAWANFGETAVARCVEDYFEYDPQETYNLEKGNAAAHVLQAVYNSIYFGQMVYPDFDMFQSHHPNAEFHAIARAANNGPIYITDRLGQQNFQLLRKLVRSDGTLLRADTPLMPTVDCLFQVQDRKAFKAFSRVGENGLLAVWNCADADIVSGLVGPTDVQGISGDEFAIYDYFQKKVFFVNRDEKLHVKLDRLDQRLFYIVNAKHGVAPLGLIEKYNALQTISQVTLHNNVLIVKLLDAGVFACAAPNSPEQVFINNRQTGFTYKNDIIYIDVPFNIKVPEIRIVF